MPALRRRWSLVDCRFTKGYSKGERREGERVVSRVAARLTLTLQPGRTTSQIYIYSFDPS